MIFLSEVKGPFDRHVDAARDLIDHAHMQTVGRQAIVTCGREGKHSVANSLHYSGRALDLRTRDLTIARIASLAYALRDALGKDWDVIVESPIEQARNLSAALGPGWNVRTNPSPHIHVEYDPKG